MSKLGENADLVLELLKDGKKIHIKEIEKNIPPADHAVLDFMKEWGLIDFEEGEATITGFGQALLNLERSP